ncbi:MAG: lytic transglycosylase domain-containing protein [bacterium]|nr:lytic transglycosylase domain-containing protein [bacterium]
MRFRVPFIALLVAVSSFAIPYAAQASGIPFFGPIIPEEQANCAANWGMVLTVINNLISFALTITIVFVAPLMIAYSGFLYVVNPVDPAGMSKAKSILQNTIVGTVIALAAWMIVDAVMAVLYNPQNPGETWYSLIGSGGFPACLPQAGITGGVIPARPTVTVVPLPSITVPPRVAPSIPTVQRFTPTLSQRAVTAAAESANNYRSQVCAAAAQQNINDQCNQLLGILGVESNGNRLARSSAGAIGLMQIMPTTAATVGVTACSGSSNTSPSAACVSALQDSATNINAGVRLYASNYRNRNVNGDVSNVIAAYNGGVGTGLNADGTKPPLAPSSDCPGLLAWQCPTNPGGLKETQDYVANVTAVATQASSL